MKFYYNDKLIRTSKNHVYTHAVINTETGSLIGCRSSLRGAQDLKASYESECRTGIHNAEAAIKAKENKKSYYIVMIGHRSFPQKFIKEDTIESLKEWKQDCIERLERIQKTWAVVELEQKA